MIATLTSTVYTWAAEPGHDHELREAVIQGFRQSGYRSLSNIECEVSGGMVVIFGVVSSFFLKQIAQTIILRFGQVEVKNNLRVQDLNSESKLC